MSERHPTPFSFYFNLLKELQKFVELFPALARGLIEKANKKPINVLAPPQEQVRKRFFLPASFLLFQRNLKIAKNHSVFV